MQNSLIDCYFFRCEIWMYKQQALTWWGRGGGGGGASTVVMVTELKPSALENCLDPFSPKSSTQTVRPHYCLNALMLSCVQSVDGLVIKRYLFFVFVFIAPLSWKIHEWSRRTYLYQIWWRVCLAPQRMDGNKTRKDSPLEQSSRSDSG